MAGGKNFNFKHKNPADIIAATKRNFQNDEPQEESIENKSIDDKSQLIKSTSENICIIKPKAEPRNRRVQLLLTESNYLKLKEYALNGGTSVNDAVNQIIENI